MILDGIKRYDENPDYDNSFDLIIETEDGKYVLYDEIQELLRPTLTANDICNLIKDRIKFIKKRIKKAIDEEQKNALVYTAVELQIFLDSLNELTSKHFEKEESYE